MLGFHYQIYTKRIFH